MTETFARVAEVQLGRLGGHQSKPSEVDQHLNYSVESSNFLPMKLMSKISSGTSTWILLALIHTNSMIVFAQDSLFIDSWTTELAKSPTLHPIEGVYSYSYTRQGFYHGELSGPLTYNGQSEANIAIEQLKDGSFYFHSSLMSSHIIARQSAIDGILVGVLHYESGNKVGVNIDVTDPRLITYSIEKPWEEVNKDIREGRFGNDIEEFSIRIFFNSYLTRIWPLKEDVARTTTEGSSEWSGNGSGVLFNGMGFVLTNHHVVEGADEVSVVVGAAGKQTEYEAGIVGFDADIDLALLKITDVAFGEVEAPPFSFQTKTSVGEDVFALGYPMALSGLGAEMKYTDGSVSANSGFNGDMKTMQISVPIQGGNSGGPLFNANGDLVGITNAKIPSDIADNVSYAIKSIFIEAFLGAMPYEVAKPSGGIETHDRVAIIDALRPYTCLVLVK